MYIMRWLVTSVVFQFLRYSCAGEGFPVLESWALLRHSCHRNSWPQLPQQSVSSRRLRDFLQDRPVLEAPVSRAVELCQHSWTGIRRWPFPATEIDHAIEKHCPGIVSWPNLLPVEPSIGQEPPQGVARVDAGLERLSQTSEHIEH